MTTTARTPVGAHISSGKGPVAAHAFAPLREIGAEALSSEACGSERA